MSDVGLTLLLVHNQPLNRLGPERPASGNTQPRRPGTQQAPKHPHTAQRTTQQVQLLASQAAGLEAADPTDRGVFCTNRGVGCGPGLQTVRASLGGEGASH